MNIKKFPHVYVILFFLIIIAAILTWIVPPNAYDFKLDAEGNPTRVIDPASYHAVDRNGIDPWEMVQAIPKGMGQVASIIFFIFIVGGSFNMIQATGAVEAGIRATAISLKGKEFWLLLVIVVLFSIGGTTFGMAEEALVFIPMLVALGMAMGYDSIVGGAGAGGTLRGILGSLHESIHPGCCTEHRGLAYLLRSGIPHHHLRGHYPGSLCSHLPVRTQGKSQSEDQPGLRR